MRFTCYMGSLQVKAFSQSLESFKTAIVVGGTNISDQVIDFELVFDSDYMIYYPRQAVRFVSALCGLLY